jgi:hypothetical protein
MFSTLPPVYRIQDQCGMGELEANIKSSNGKESRRIQRIRTLIWRTMGNWMRDPEWTRSLSGAVGEKRFI